MRILILLLLILNLVAISTAQPRASRDEYQIYSIVLRQIYEKNVEEFSGKNEFVFASETAVVGEDIDLKAVRRYRGLIRDFRAKNASPAFLEKKFPFENYHIIAQREYEQIIENAVQEDKKNRREHPERYKYVAVGGPGPGSIAFFRKFPDSSGFYTLSRVGFSTDHRQALVVVNAKQGCFGFTKAYLLRKVGGRWKSNELWEWSSTC